MPVLGLRPLNKCPWYASLADPCQVSTELCGGVKSKGLVKVRPAELSGTHRPRFGTLKGGLFSSGACNGKMVSFLEPNNPVCPRFCQEEMKLSRGFCQESGR